MTNTLKYASTVIALSVVTFGSMIQTAAAQQMGRDGYRFPARNPSMAAQFQFQRSATSSTDAGLGALTTDVAVDNSVENAGNLTEILAPTVPATSE